MKKLIALLLAAVMVIGMLAGCGSKSETPAPTAAGNDAPAATDAPANNDTPAPAAKDSVNLTFGSDPGTLAPNGNAGPLNSLLWAMYDHLWYVNNAGEFVYRVATSCEYTDEVTMLVTIRDDVTDSNGVKLTASDVLFSIKVAASDTSNASYKGAVRYLDLDACNVVDDTHVNLVLKAPNILQQAMLQNVNLVTEESYNASPDGMTTTPVGTGAYVLKDAVMGTSYVLEAREGYWGGEQNIKHITFRSIDESAQRINALQAGELDAVALDATDVESGLAIPGTAQFACQVADTVGIIFNCESPACGNKELRKAIACAIDNAAIRAVGYAGQGSIPAGFLNPGLTGWEKGHDEAAQKYDNYYEYNVETAKAHLAASGVAEGTTITVAITNNEVFVKTAQIIQAELAEIGLNVVIDTWDAATFNDTMDSNPERYDMALVGYSTSTGATLGLVFTWLTGAANYHHWANTEKWAEVKDLVAKAQTETDVEKRNVYGREISDILADEVPMYSYVCKSFDYVAKEDLNIVVYKDWTIDFTQTSWN